MPDPKMRRWAPATAGATTPLNVAMARLQRHTLDLVRDAIRHRQTVLAYQPIMRADDATKVAFYEGLIRIVDASGRIIPAQDFMPFVEENELGREIDVCALRQGLTALEAHPGLRLSINMSARSIGYGAWMATLKRFLKRDETIGERLILEITESSSMQVPELVIDFMERVRFDGVCFALDDFGAGHTAIRYFKDFDFDILKIDGQFVRGIAQDADNRAITSALLSIAHHFDMLTVAEAVENASDAAMLAEMGVNCLQGYFFAAPTVQPSWLKDRRRRAG